MNGFIKKKTNEFIRLNIKLGFSDVKRTIGRIEDITYSIDSVLDQTHFLTAVLESNQEKYKEHLVDCTSPESCQTNLGHEELDYYLKQELNKLGISANEDSFTIDELEAADSKLDKILEELNSLKNGQEVIYEDLRAEIEELRNLYFLGKKNWRQLFKGKISEMIVSGIISETVSKKIVSYFKDEVIKLIA